MEFIDTHCHIQSSGKQTGDAGEAATMRLWSKADYPTGDQLIARAVEVGVSQMICVGCSLLDSELAVRFVQDRPECYASIGIHPHEAATYLVGDTLDPVQTKRFAALAGAPKVVAIGECGLDYYYEHSTPDAQKIMLKLQLELALKHDLPLIFHVRDAFDDFWPIFDACAGLRGVLHSFTDNQANLDKALERGLYIGVNGIATFTKSSEQREMYKNIPLSRLLLETDSPFLTPSPYRGKICEPYHTRVTAEFLAEQRNQPLRQLAAATTANAHTLFNV